MIADNYGFSWLNVDLPFECAIHFSFRRNPFDKKKFNVLVIHTEPEPIRISEVELENTWQDYDLIISHDKRHTKYSNVIISYYWETLVKSIPFQKIFNVSTIISIGGGPANMSGYKIREKLYNRRLEILMPTSFYISRRIPNWEMFGLPLLPEDKKDAMFTSMFHIAIENEIETDYFSEKILDCFNGFTVPIYRGCQNLLDHGLDERAVIRFNSIEECISICNNLSPMDYYSRMSYVVNNRKKLLEKPFWQSEVQNNCLIAWASKQTKNELSGSQP